MTDMITNGSDRPVDRHLEHLPVQMTDRAETAFQPITMDELEDRVASGLHSGFKLRGGTICTADNTEVCDLILPLCWARRADGSGYAVEVAFATRNRTIAHMVLDNAELEGRRAIARLADHGFILIGTSSDFKKLLRFWRHVPDALRADHAGWLQTPSGEVYMRADGTCQRQDPTSPSPALLVGPQNTQSAGTLAGWQDAVARPALGNDLLIFGICATLAAPLMRPADLQTAMFHIHGKGPIGKSHLVAVAASADRAPHLRQSWSVDPVRLEDLLGHSRDGMLDLDCLPENPSGQLLGRLTGLGDEAASGKHDRTWRGIRLSTGERPLSNLLVRNRKIVPAAMTSRVIDIAADIGRHGVFQELHGHEDAGSFLAAMRQGMEAHHGHLMPAFIDWIVHDCSAITRALPEQIVRTVAEILRRAELPTEAATGPRREALRRLALVAIAGEMAITRGLLPWPGSSAIAAVSAITGRWRLGQDAASDYGDVLLHLEAFINQNHAALTWIDAASASDRADPEKGWQDDEFVYLTSGQLDAIPHLRDALPDLVKTGIVVPGKERNSWKYRMGRQFKDRWRYYRIRKGHHA